MSRSAPSCAPQLAPSVPAAAAAVTSHSIWHAARQGDEAYVREFIAQVAAAEEHRTGARGATSIGGGGGGSAAHRATPGKKRGGGGKSHGTTSVAADDADSLRALNADGLSPLHVAVIYQQRRIVRLLLDGGACALQGDRESQWSALAHALYRGDFITAHLLLRTSSNSGAAAAAAAATVRQLDGDGLTPFDLVREHINDATQRRRREQLANASFGRSVEQRFLRENSLADNTRQSAFHALSNEKASAADDVPPFNLLFSLGYQSQYTLGYSCDHYQHRARLLESFHGASVTQVVALRQAVFVLLSDGTVTSHGQGQSGKLGHESIHESNRETLIEPKRIASLHDIKFIAGTDEYVCTVSEKGAVFAFGYSPFIVDGVVGVNPSTAAPVKSSSSSRLQAGSHSPPPASRTLDSASSVTPSTVRYSQLPRRLEAFRSFHVAQVYPSAHRLLVLTDSGELFFIGQSIEDAERWETTPKKFAGTGSTVGETIVQVTNRDDFVAILTDAGVIRLQRRGERKMNKLWLQNYSDPAPTHHGYKEAASSRAKTIRDFFPQIPMRAHVTQMAWTPDGQRGAAVTREGQLFTWKLPPPELKRPAAAAATSSSALTTLVTFPSSSSPSLPLAGDTSRSSTTFFPRCIGYLVDGLVHVHVTSVAIAKGHTTAITTDGHVYTFGPACLGHVHPSESVVGAVSSSSAAASASITSAQSTTGILRPRRLLHLSQVSSVHASEQYLLVLVGIRQPLVLPSFPEMFGIFDQSEEEAHNGRNKRVAKPAEEVEVPSLRVLCQHHLAQEITPASVIAAYQWASSTDSRSFLDYCTKYLLANLSYYLPAILGVHGAPGGALHDVASLVELQRCYAQEYPLWFYSPAYTQPLQPSDTDLLIDESDDSQASHFTAAPSSLTSQHDELFSFSHSLAQLKLAAVKASQPKTVEERVAEIKTRRRALTKKLAQIALLEDGPQKKSLDPEQKSKVAWKSHVVDELAQLDNELTGLRDQGSVSAAKLWETIHNSAAVTAPPIESKLVEASESKHSSDLSSRVSSELLRPVRAIASSASKQSSELELKSNRKMKPAAATTAPAASTTTIASAVPAIAASTRPVSAATVASWKSSNTPVVASAAVISNSKPALSSFAAIQAEEARAAAATAERQRQIDATKQRSGVSDTMKSFVGIIPSGGKGWGAPSVSPILQPTASVSQPKNDFPSLGAAAVHSHQTSAASSSASLFKAASPIISRVIPSSSHSPPLRAAVAPTNSQPAVATGAPSSGVFSLADFLPKAKASQHTAALVPTPIKGWNTAGAIAVVDAPVQHQHNQPAPQVPTIGAAPQKGKGKDKSNVQPIVPATPPVVVDKKQSKRGAKNAASDVAANAAPAAAPNALLLASASPPFVASSPPVMLAAAPMSLLSIQQAEVLRCYGAASTFKTQRQLDAEEELRTAAVGGRTKWNGMNVASAASVASAPGLAELQAQQLAADLAVADAARNKEYQKAKKKAKRAAAKERDAIIATEAAEAAKVAKQQQKQQQQQPHRASQSTQPPQAQAPPAKRRPKDKPQTANPRPAVRILPREPATAATPATATTIVPA